MDTTIYYYFESSDTSLTQLKVDAVSSILTDFIKQDSIFKEEFLVEYRAANSDIGISSPTVIVPVLIFAAGLLAQLVWRWYKQALDRIVFKHLLESVIMNFRSMVQPYRDLATNTKVESGILLNPPINASQYHKRLLDMDIIDLYTLSNEKALVSNILGQIDTLTKQQLMVDDYHKVALAKSSEIKKRISEISFTYANELRELEKKRNAGIFFDMSVKMPVMWKEYVAFEQRRYKDNLFVSIEDFSFLINKNLEYLSKENINKEWSNEFYIIAYEYNNYIEKLHRLYDEFRAQYGSFADELERILKDLYSQYKKVRWNNKMSFFYNGPKEDDDMMRIEDYE